MSRRSGAFVLALILCTGAASAEDAADGVQGTGAWENGKREGPWTITVFGPDEDDPDGQLRIFDHPGSHFPSAIGMATGTFHEGLREGMWVFTTPYGGSRRGKYRHDKREGVWTATGPTGRRRSEGTYEAGQRSGLWQVWSLDGTLLTKGEYENGLRHGSWWARVYPEGFEEGMYANGLKTGHWHREMRDRGQSVTEDGAFREGERVGLWTTTRGDRTTEHVYAEARPREDPGRTSGREVAGHKQGFWIEYDANGRKSAEGRYVDGQRDGVWTEWFPYGERREGTWVKGVEEGPSSTFNNADTRVEEGTMHAGRREGRWREWFPGGAPKFDGTYAAGRLQGHVRTWGAGGAIASEGDYDRGLKQGPWKDCTPAAYGCREGTYRDDREEGLWRSTATDGHVTSETTYVAGKAEGPAREFDGAGRLAHEGSYTNGKKEGRWRHVAGTDVSYTMEHEGHTVASWSAPKDPTDPLDWRTWMPLPDMSPEDGDEPRIVATDDHRYLVVWATASGGVRARLHDAGRTRLWELARERRKSPLYPRNDRLDVVAAVSFLPGTGFAFAIAADDGGSVELVGLDGRTRWTSARRLPARASHPAIVETSDHGLLVAWSEPLSAGGWAFRARRFASDGASPWPAPVTLGRGYRNGAAPRLEARPDGSVVAHLVRGFDYFAVDAGGQESDAYAVSITRDGSLAAGPPEPLRRVPWRRLLRQAPAPAGTLAECLDPSPAAFQATLRASEVASRYGEKTLEISRIEAGEPVAGPLPADVAVPWWLTSGAPDSHPLIVLELDGTVCGAFVKERRKFPVFEKDGDFPPEDVARDAILRFGKEKERVTAARVAELLRSEAPAARFVGLHLTDRVVEASGPAAWEVVSPALVEALRREWASGGALAENLEETLFWAIGHSSLTRGGTAPAWWPAAIAAFADAPERENRDRERCQVVAVADPRVACKSSEWRTKARELQAFDVVRHDVEGRISAWLAGPQDRATTLGAARGVADRMRTLPDPRVPPSAPAWRRSAIAVLVAGLESAPGDAFDELCTVVHAGGFAIACGKDVSRLGIPREEVLARELRRIRESLRRACDARGCPEALKAHLERRLAATVRPAHALRCRRYPFCRGADARFRLREKGDTCRDEPVLVCAEPAKLPPVAPDPPMFGPWEFSGPQDDDDHDGVVNASDDCRDDANPDQADLDGDGQGDACDDDVDDDGADDFFERDGTSDPRVVDSNANGVPDGIELWGVGFLDGELLELPKDHDAGTDPARWVP